MVNQMREELKRNRQKKVLDMIVKYYTSTAEPVGSHIIAKEMDLSSATIRNIMFELERANLIRQPHISAGRIPTDKGYRVYVDNLMGGEFTESDVALDDALTSLKCSSIEDVILKGLQLCSRLTSQACIAFFPSLKLKERIVEKLQDNFKNILTSFYDFQDRIYLDGAHYLAEQPEFKDIEKIGSVLRILEEKKSLRGIMEEDLKISGINVHIGSENTTLGFDECTLITASYNVENDIFGSLGIIGPIRMEYDRVIPTVSHIAESISSLFGEML